MQDILQAFGVNWKLLFVQLINFGLLLFLLHRYLYTPVFVMLEKREKKITQGLKDAEEVAHEKSILNEKREEVLSEVRKEGDRIISQVRIRGKEEEKKILLDAEKNASKIIAEAEALGKESKESIIKESQEELARIAVRAAEKILRGIIV